MRLHPLLASLAFGCLTFLGACDPSTVSSLAPSAATGKAGFRLSSSDSLAVAGTVDSVLLTATTEHGTRQARGAVGSPLVIANLPEGRCLLQADLFDRAGLIHWSGSDTVEVIAGQQVQASLVLHKVTGSVLVDVTLDSTAAIDSSFALYSTTYLPDYPKSFQWTLDAQGNATRLHFHYVDGAQVVDTSVAKVDSGTMAGFRTLLQAAAARHPSALPKRYIPQDTALDSQGNLVITTPLLCGGSTTIRNVRYADGSSASTTLSTTVSEASSDWISLDPIDAELVRLLPYTAFFN